VLCHYYCTYVCTLQRYPYYTTAAAQQKRNATNRDATGSALLFRVTLSAVARRRLQRGMRDMARHPKDLLRHGLIELEPPTAGRSVTCSTI
jgi:hypothetical protein